MEIKTLKAYIAPLFGAVIALPLLYLLFYALSEGFGWDAFKGLNLDTYLKNTAYLVVMTGFFVLLLGSVGAYLVSRFAFFGSRFFAVALMLPLAIPSFVAGYAYNGIFEYRGLFSQLFGIEYSLDILNIYGAVFIFSITMFPYVFIVAKAAYSSLSESVAEIGKNGYQRDQKALSP